MKRILIFLSDLHLGNTSLAQIQAMKERIVSETREAEILWLFILGDLGESTSEFEAVLDLFKEMASIKALVIGNHDLCNQEGFEAPIRRYESLFPGIAQEHGYKWGEDRPIFVAPGAAVVLTPAWPRPQAIGPDWPFTRSEVLDWWVEELPNGRSMRNLDHDRLSYMQLEQFEQNLRSVPEYVRQIIVGTHVPVFVELTTPVNGRWGPLDAFFVSPKFGEAILRHNSEMGYARVTDVISGHLHKARQATIAWHHHQPTINAQVIESAYGKPGWMAVDLDL